MQGPEFEREFARLSEHFGSRHYSNEFKKMIWESLKYLPDGVMRHMVTHAIKNLRLAPLYPDFQEMIRSYSMRPKAVAQITKMYCDFCGGHGYAICQSSDGQHEAAGLCHKCETGRSLSSTTKIAYIKKLQSNGYPKVKFMNPEDGKHEVKVKGMPYILDVACVLIQSGEIARATQRRICEDYKLSEDDLWKVYESWCSGVVDDLVKNKKANAGSMSEKYSGATL